jgi:hypothetical protein
VKWRIAGWGAALAYLWSLLRWSARPEHFFFADDWDWLYRAVRFPLHDQFTLLPRFVLNDRPVGGLAFRVLYAFFGLNPVPFHWFCLALHLVNMTLLLVLARRLMRCWWAAAATALAYGTWSAAIEGATWMAGIFDVLGDTLMLGVMLTFTSPRWWVRAGSVPLYYLAVRTKETAIVLPALLLVVVLVSHPRPAMRVVWPHVLMAAVFAAVYVPLLAQHQRVEDASNPYRMEFSARVFGEGLFYYVSRMLYGGPWPMGRLIRWTTALVALSAGLAWRTRAALVGMAGFVIFLGPVIFMAHQRQALYLYIPGAFFVLALGGALEAAAQRLRAREETRKAAAVGMILLCVAALPHRANMRRRSDWLLAHTARARQDLEAFRAKVGSLRPGARVALIGFPEDYHVFQTRGCSVLKVVYRVEPVSCGFATDGASADVVVVWRRDGVEVMSVDR